MIDLIVVRKDISRGVYEAKTVSRLCKGLSDHIIVWYKIKLLKAWVRKRMKDIMKKWKEKI